MATQVEYPPEVHCYFTSHELDEEDDEVYRISGGPGSTQGIWKKFELIPTPPLSPSIQAVSSGASSPTCLTSSPSDTLQTVSDILDIDSSRTALLFPDNSCPNLKSKLIQDCMWGCREKFQRVAYIENVYDTPCSTPPPLDYVSADCVDPSSVFPYPINNNNQEVANDDSSEDEGEIDVVTIEKPVKRKVSSPPECISIDDHTTTSTDLEPPAKKPRSMHKKLRGVKEAQEINREMCSSSKEKQEDPECKRTVHNVLERKRRNDLKYSFQILRDSVPELEGSERSPKVLILKKATDCIHKLKSEEDSLTKQMDILEKEHQSLLRKLKSLQELSK